MNVSIEVNNITKRYKERTVVDKLSFKVMKGEVFGLLGHNGAGKSTTIDCMLGLVKMNEGSAYLLGQQANKHRKELFEHIGVQLQDCAYQDNINVAEACLEKASLYKHPADYEALLKQFHLERVKSQKVSALSGGERQKLSVVIALIPNPDIIFLDELTTGLDVAARREVWQILKKLKEQGLTIFLTSHYMEEVETLCDHILILKEGKMMVEGSVQDIIDKSPYKTLEEAYLWYTKEEAFL